MSIRSLRSLVAGIQALGPVTIRGQENTGAYLSTMVAVNPQHPAEAGRTTLLISEFGRLTSAALYESERAESLYRAWRDNIIWTMTNDMEAAEEAGFASVCEPGEDAKGNPKPQKLPSNAIVERYIRTLPEYREMKDICLTAQEAWGSAHAAYTASQARQWAIRAFDGSGGTDDSRRTSQEPVDDPAHHYHGGHGDVVADMEASAKTGERTPLPASGPPGPPPSSTPAAPPSKAAPPPPPNRS